MAKQLQFSFNNQSFIGTLGGKIEKKDLYGFVKTIAVDENGNELVKGYLTPTGEVLLKSEFVTEKIDNLGSVVDSISAYQDEILIQETESSFDIVSALTTATDDDLHAFNVLSVYPVENLSLSEGLYKTSFNYRKGYLPKEALLLKKNDSWFLLVGESRLLSWIGESVHYDFFEQETEVEEEFTFDML